MNRRDEFAFLNFDSLPGSVGVSAPVFAAVLGVSIPTLYGWVKSEILPAPRKIATTSRWLVSQVREAQGIAAGAQHE
ncbi:MAG: hypothetical protein ABI887_06755 [Burkholderiales bacterium]